MREFVEHVMQMLAEHPDDIQISMIQGRQGVIMEVRCHSEDMGRLIGKNGKTIGAVRALLSNIAARQGLKTTLEVVE